MSDPLGPMDLNWLFFEPEEARPGRLICPPARCGDCGIFCFSVAVLYRIEQSIARDSNTELGLTFSFPLALRDRMEKVSSQDELDSLVTDTIRMLRGVLSTSKQAKDLAIDLVELKDGMGHDDFFEMYSDMAYGLDALDEPAMFLEYLAGPLVWLSLDMMDRLSSSVFQTGLSIGSGQHDLKKEPLLEQNEFQYDKGHQYLSLPNDEHTQSLLSKGLSHYEADYESGRPLRLDAISTNSISK